MRISILSIGRERDAHIAALCDEYIKRLKGEVGLVLLDERKAIGSGTQKEREARLLETHLPKGAYIVALDERGQNLTSQAFADHLTEWGRDGRAIVFLIGGADGLDTALRDKAHARIALGAMTWPHRLVRIMILEQIYRARMITAGHPYHRAS